VLWRREEKVTSGSRIRKLIQTSGDWEKWVSPATAKVIREFGIDERIRKSRADSLVIPKSV
jgi:hypothetical protein